MASVETTTQNNQVAAAKVAGMREVTYFSKTPRLKDEDGKDIGPGVKPDDVKVMVPDPSAEKLIAYLSAADGTEEAKVRDLILDGIRDVIFLSGRRQINEWREANPDGMFKATDMDLSKLTLEAIANTPKGQRGAWAPSDEDMKDFMEDYTNIMLSPAVAYDPKKTKNHCDHFKNGFTKIKNSKPVIEKLKEFLTVWAANTTEEGMEENVQTYDWLVARADKYLKAEEKNFLDAV